MLEGLGWDLLEQCSIFIRSVREARVHNRVLRASRLLGSGVFPGRWCLKGVEVKRRLTRSWSYGWFENRILMLFWFSPIKMNSCRPWVRCHNVILSTQAAYCLAISPLKSMTFWIFTYTLIEIRTGQIFAIWSRILFNIYGWVMLPTTLFRTMIFKGVCKR